MNKTHYFLSPVLIYDGAELKLALHRALVSGRGIYKAFEQTEEMQRAFHEGRLYKARIDGVDYPARLVREAGPAGTHYNLAIDDGEKLKSLLGRYGFESPWRRDFARIPSGDVYARCEAPVGAVLLHQNTSAEVRNFSYHGLFLELHTPAGEAVGQRINLRLMTSRGKLLDECVGKVARVYDEMMAPGLLRRGLGIRLVEMPERARELYHGMILDAFRTRDD